MSPVDFIITFRNKKGKKNQIFQRKTTLFVRNFRKEEIKRSPSLSDENDREDAVQSAIEKAWRKADSLREPNKLKPWLVRILANECHEVLRRRKREIPTENLPEESAPPPQEQRELRELVMSLPENERLPIVLHYLEGFSTQEIASALRCPKGTVLSRMSRGRRQLKRFLTEE